MQPSFFEPLLGDLLAATRVVDTMVELSKRGASENSQKIAGAHPSTVLNRYYIML